MEYYLFTLVIAAGLAFIPANIAKNKGHSFGLWWFYGWMLFIVAIIHVNFIPDKTAEQQPVVYTVPTGHNAPAAYNAPMAPVAPLAPMTPMASAPPAALSMDVVEELRCYKQLLDEGILTQEEFDKKKRQLLNL